jgi:protein O-mannosyl-transferase
MNNPKKNIQKKGSTSPAKPKPQGVQSAVQNNSAFNIQNPTFLLAGVSIFIFICFHYTLNNQFLNWDDWIYIARDKNITSFTAEHLNNLLFRNITLNYYHPITMLSLAVNYMFSELNPWGYYLTNVLFHILNAILVFYTIKTIMEAMVKVGYKAMPILPWLLAIGALLHGVHPMHVESVAWIAERKDVMYAVFYFIGLMMYVRYIQGERLNWMLYLNSVLALGCVWGMIGLHNFSLDVTHTFSINNSVLLAIPLVLLVAAIVVEVKYKNINLGLIYVMEFFLLSMFSKPMAVSFPLAIIVLDFLLKRDLKYAKEGKGLIYNEWIALWHFVAEKWMFFVIAFLSGIQSAYMQTGTNSLAFTNGYTVAQKGLIACYTFSTYMAKFFYPANLCSYYPFPNLTYEHYLPSIFYAAPFIAAAIVFVPLFLARKNENLFRVVLFGLGFYFVNLMFVLQFLSSGTTIISERYSYVAYFGPIFVLIYLAHWFLNSKPLANSYRLIAIKGSLVGVCLLLGYLSYQRTKVWHNPETLWTDVINKTQGTFAQTPYFNLGSYYIDSGKYEKAFIPFTVLVKMGNKDPMVSRDLAMIYGMHKQYDSSLYFFSRALKYDSNDATVYTNRAITYANLGKFDLALNDFTKAYSIDTTQNVLLAQKAGLLMQLGHLNEAISDYTKLIGRDPKEPNNYFARGNAYLNGGSPGMAINDYLHVLELQPKNGNCMYDLSIAYHKMNDNAHAMEYANMAQSAGYKLPDNYLNTLK